MMEKLYVVQWLSHEGNWQVCQGFGFDGQDIPVVHFERETALEDLAEWQEDTGEPDRYRMIEIEVKGV